MRDDIIRKRTKVKQYMIVLFVFWVCKLVEFTFIPLLSCNYERSGSFMIKQALLYIEVFCFIVLIFVFRPEKNLVNEILNGQQEMAYGLVPLLLD